MFTVFLLHLVIARLICKWVCLSDDKSIVGKQVKIASLPPGTIARIGQHKVYVQPHEGGPLLRLSLASVVPSPTKRFAVGECDKSE